MKKCTIQANHEFKVTSTSKMLTRYLVWEKCTLCNLSITRIIKN